MTNCESTCDRLFLREAEMTDIDVLYEWANDPLTRLNSFNSGFIPYEDHKKWFTKMMQDSACHQFILMNGEQPIGQIRLNVNRNNNVGADEKDEADADAEIGYSIAKDYRNLGYGHKILQLLTEKVESQLPEIKSLIAKVKPNNLASKKLFEKEGYDLKYCCYSLSVTPPPPRICFARSIARSIAGILSRRAIDTISYSLSRSLPQTSVLFVFFMFFMFFWRLRHE